jgi:hypothetical protein
LTAATTLVEWAHARRRRWTDEPLPRPEVRKAREVLEVREVLESLWVPELPEAPKGPRTPEVAEVPEVPIFSDDVDAFELPPAPGVREVWEASGVLGEPQLLAPEAAAFQNTEVLSLASDITPWHDTEAAAATPDVAAAPRAKWTDVFSHLNWKSFAGFFGLCRTAASKSWALTISLLEHLRPLGEPSVRWLTRGAALVATAAVLMLFVVHRTDLFSSFDRAALVSRFDQIDLSKVDLSSHLDRVKQKVAAATARPAPPPTVPLPRGFGQLTIASPNDDPLVFVDGKPRGKTPVTVTLLAGNHRLLLRSGKGSVEKTVRVEAGESTELDESIFPGWVAVAAAIDLTISENGRTLKKDERGWAILPPGPHEIHLDNEQLGIHETRKIVVTPGDATRVSLAAQNSTLTVTTNEPAEIWIDGTSVGEAPLTDAPMTLGWHDVRVRSAAHEKWLRVRVTSRPAQLNVDLTTE